MVVGVVVVLAAVAVAVTIAIFAIIYQVDKKILWQEIRSRDKVVIKM